MPPDPEHLAEVAHALALRLLTSRARTRSELAADLGRRGVPVDCGGTVLDRLQRVGLIDDAATGAAHARRRSEQRVGAAAIAAELRVRGIDAALAERLAGEASPPAGEADGCRRAAEIRLGQLRGLPAAARARRLAGYLARRGYPIELVRVVVGELVPDAGETAATAGRDD